MGGVPMIEREVAQGLAVPNPGAIIRRLLYFRYQAL